MLKLKPRPRKYRLLDNYGCVLTHDHTRWCFGICKPHKGVGQCGRLYPHNLKSLRQRAIAEWQKQKAQEASGG